MSIVKRLFSNPGMEAHYKLMVTIDSALSVHSRIFLELGVGFSPRINREQRVECYLTNSPVFDIYDSNPAFCELTNSRSIRIETNNKINSVFYIDILGISMPRQFPSSSNSLPLHWLGIEDDGDPWNGIAESISFQDSFPSSQPFTSL